MTAELEVVVDRRMSGEKLLGLPDRFEPPHVTLSLSGGLVRDFAAIVEIPALPMFNAREDLAFRSAIGPELIRHEYPWHVAQALQQLAEEALGRLCAPAALDQHVEHVEHVSMLINRSPQIMEFAPDANEHLVQKPFVAGLRSAPFECLGVPPSNLTMSASIHLASYSIIE